MELGQSSRSNEEEDDDDGVWAKLVPTDARYQEIELRSQDTLICSEVIDSSTEKFTWCEISGNSDHDSARIRNMSSNEIIVDGTAVGEEAVDIKNRSQVTSGPHKQGFLSYTFQVVSSQKLERKNLKISLDVEHAECSICLNIWHDVVTVAPCLHNFCNGCFSEWLRSSTQSQDKHKSVLCPQCRTIVHSVGRNHFLHNVEEAILQNFSSLKHSDEEIAQLDTYASVKSNLVLGIKKKTSRKRPLSTLSDDGSDAELPCPQCGAELGGFRCGRSTTHLQCQGCRGLMPSRPDAGVPQHCLGCNRAFCGPYWRAQGVDANEYAIICNQQIFRPISERTISRIPESVHQNNQYEKDVTERCIQQTGKTLQAVISDWIVKFNNREVDRLRLQLNHAETITSRTHLCNDCYNKLIDFLLYWFRVTMPRSLAINLIIYYQNRLQGRFSPGTCLVEVSVCLSSHSIRFLHKRERERGNERERGPLVFLADRRIEAEGSGGAAASEGGAEEEEVGHVRRKKRGACGGHGRDRGRFRSSTRGGPSHSVTDRRLLSKRFDIQSIGDHH